MLFFGVEEKKPHLTVAKSLQVYYATFGRMPEAIWVHESMVHKIGWQVQGVDVVCSMSVLPNHFWLKGRGC